MQEQLETILADLVAIPSDSNDPAACRQILEYAQQTLAPLGFHISGQLTSQHPWFVATTQATKRPRIMLVAHLDVVAGEPHQYQLKADGDKLYGRGAWDMKYAAAVYLALAINWRQRLSNYDFGIFFSTDEELGGHDGARAMLAEGWRTELAVIPDYREAWLIEEGAKGFYSCHLTAHGRSGHASRPWDGHNAAHTLMDIATTLRHRYPSHQPLGPTLCVTKMNAGEALSKIPGSATMQLDFRTFDPAERERFLEELTVLAKQHNTSVDITTYGLPVILDKQHPLVKQYQASLAACGVVPAYQKSLGGTDARWFAEYDIPCLVTGPAGAGAHGQEEWVERQSLGFFYTLVSDYLERVAKTSQPQPVETAAHIVSV